MHEAQGVLCRNREDRNDRYVLLTTRIGEDK